MRSSKSWIWASAVAVIVVLTIAGCGGGSSSTPPSGNNGAVSGRVEDFTQQVGLGGITVTIGGQSAVSDVNGNFTVTGVDPGQHAVSVVAPAATNLVLPPGSPIAPVFVAAGQTTQLPATIFMMDKNDLPPGTP